MKTVFIGDAHLKGTSDENQEAFCTFLESIKDSDIKKLVIMGDLFDFWIGYNDIVFYHYLPVLNKIQELKKSGMAITYIEGNHDFSLGSYFTKELDIEVHDKSFTLNMDNKKMLIMHGDTADTSISYTFWRAFMRSIPMKALRKILSPSSAWTIANYLSKSSRKYNDERGRNIDSMLKSHALIEIDKGFDVVIMGHSHLAGIHKLSGDNHEGLYINSGSWLNKEYVLFENGRYEIKTF